jgi:2-methylisocitrate lyase-like PEP mutase family enzyme
MRVAFFAVRAFLDELADAGTQRPWLDRMMTRAELDELLSLSKTRIDEDRLSRIGANLASLAARHER